MKYGKHLKGNNITKLEDVEALASTGTIMNLNTVLYSISQLSDINKLTETETNAEKFKTASFISHRSQGAYIISLSRPYLRDGFALLA